MMLFASCACVDDSVFVYRRLGEHNACVLMFASCVFVDVCCWMIVLGRPWITEQNTCTRDSFEGVFVCESECKLEKLGTF